MASTGTRTPKRPTNIARDWRWAKKSPLRRVGQPIDLARAALFLASDEAAFITGHGLNVDGGLMLRV